MNKTRQQELIRWLKQQSSRAKGWIRLSMMLGLLSGLLILAQAWLMAGLLHSLIIQHTPREAPGPSAHAVAGRCRAGAGLPPHRREF